MKRLFDVVVYGLLVFSIAAGLHAALPPEYQVEGFTNLTALVSGASAGLIGSAGLTFKTWLAKAKTESDKKYVQVATQFLQVIDQYKELETKYEVVANKFAEYEKKTIQQYHLVGDKLDKIALLVKAEIDAKLSSKLIDAEVKAILEGAIDEKEVV